MLKITYKKCLLCLVLFITLLSCGCNDSNITINNSEYIQKDSNTDSVASTNAIDNYSLLVKVDDSKCINIPIRNVNLLYSKLTQDLDENNSEHQKLIKSQLDRINPQVIYSSNQVYYILLNYNCGVKMCDYMLIKYSDKNLETLDLKFGLYANNKISSDKNTIALIFLQSEGTSISNAIMLIDMNNMQVKESPNIPEDYTYKLLSYEWKDNNLYLKYCLKNNEQQETKIILK